jgi:hypothetical protein
MNFSMFFMQFPIDFINLMTRLGLTNDFFHDFLLSFSKDKSIILINNITLL